MALFKSDPQLSYPNFNTYRLDSEIGPQNITTTDISPHYATASRVSHSQQLSFKEVQARIGWDHLAVGPNSQDVCYIDEDYNVIRVTIDKSHKPVLEVVASLPVPLPVSTSSETSEPTPEFPSVLALPRPISQIWSRIYLASAGTGTLHVVSRPGMGDLVTEKSLDLRSPDDMQNESMESTKVSPFLLRSLRYETQDQIEVLVTRTIRERQQESVPGSKSLHKQVVSYEIISFSLDISPMASDSPLPLSYQENWRCRGEEFPTYVKYMNGRWIIGGGKVYRLHSRRGQPVTTATASQDPSAGLEPTESAGTEVNAGSEADYPYTWSQTKHTISFAIDHLPADILASRDIVCLLRPSTLTLQIRCRDENTSLAPKLQQFLRNGGKQGQHDWWDRIKGEESTWTWEKDTDVGSGSTHGRLEMTLEKANEGVKWPQLFAPRQDNDDNDPDLLMSSASHASLNQSENEWKYSEIEVPETMTEEDQAYVKESLAGLHQQPLHSAEKSYAGLGHPDLAKPVESQSSSTGELSDRATAILPGLMREELEEEDDWDTEHLDGGEFGSLGGAGSSKAGRETVFTYIEDADKDAPIRVRHFPKTVPASVLSWPLKGNQYWEPEKDDSLIVKAHVDGDVYTPPMHLDDISWKHVATSPALSFVIASKREAQFVYHRQRPEGTTVYLFESRQSYEMGGNVYIYYPAGGPGVVAKQVTEAKQAVVKFGADVEVGQLLGVKSVKTAGGQDVIVGLAEKAIIVLAT